MRMKKNKGMLTRQAFKQMINTREIFKVIRENAYTVRRIRYDIKRDKWPTIDRMEKMLIKAGWYVVQEKVWRID